MHRNKTNQKVYIGQTAQLPNKRWKNGNGYKRHQYFYNAIQKYGWDGFDHLILETVENQSQANEREYFYIQQYKANDPNYGYNILSGGSSSAGKNNPMYGRKHTTMAKKKISDVALNRSEDTHKKMSEAAKRRVLRDGAPFEGKHLSEEAKEKLRQVDKSYTQTPEYREKMSLAVSGAKNSAAIKIRAINVKTNEIIHFGYKQEALTFLGLSRSSSKFLNKAITNHTVYHGYYWEEE